jgi:hypothetical protein
MSWLLLVVPELFFGDEPPLDRGVPARSRERATPPAASDSPRRTPARTSGANAPGELRRLRPGTRLAARPGGARRPSRLFRQT